MKTKLICCALSMLLLCGCSPRLNNRYIVTSCEIDTTAWSTYTIECDLLGDDDKRYGPSFRFVSHTPLAVGGKYCFKMEETK